MNRPSFLVSVLDKAIAGAHNRWLRARKVTTGRYWIVQSHSKPEGRIATDINIRDALARFRDPNFPVEAKLRARVLSAYALRDDAKLTADDCQQILQVAIFGSLPFGTKPVFVRDVKQALDRFGDPSSDPERYEYLQNELTRAIAWEEYLY